MMKRLTAVLLALLMITSAALATELAPGVYKLEDGTVDEIIAKYNAKMIEIAG